MCENRVRAALIEQGSCIVIHLNGGETGQMVCLPKSSISRLIENRVRTSDSLPSPEKPRDPDAKRFVHTTFGEMVKLSSSEALCTS